MRWTYTGPLWWISFPGTDSVHIARSNLEGMQTECGLTLQKGWTALRRDERPLSCCRACDESIAAINPIHGRGYAI